MSLDDRAHQLADARITDLCLFAGQGGDGVTRDRRVHIPDIVDRFLAPLGEMSTAADRRIIVENVAVDGKSLDVFFTLLLRFLLVDVRIVASQGSELVRWVTTGSRRGCR